jgi:hypothetical protein
MKSKKIQVFKFFAAVPLAHGFVLVAAWTHFLHCACCSNNHKSRRWT